MTKAKRIFWIVMIALLGGLVIADRLLVVKNNDVSTFSETMTSIEDQNKIRKKYGVPTIEKEWVLADSNSKYLHWTNRRRGVNTLEPFHMSKTILLRQGKAVVEEDDFHFEASDSIAYRLVLIHQYGENGVMKRVENEFITYYRGRYPPSSKKMVRNEFVDSVLHTWNLEPTPVMTKN